jgi:hypothetical protein
MVPSASTWPPVTNALVQGVSTRELPYLFDEPGGEHKKSLIHPPNRSPIIRMYVCLPFSRGSQAETRTLSLYYIPATQQTLAQQVRGAEGGSTRVVLLQLRLSIRVLTQGIFQYNNVLGSPSQSITTAFRRSLCSILALENSTHHLVGAIRMYTVLLR